jgi:hypothetical protein
MELLCFISISVDPDDIISLESSAGYWGKVGDSVTMYDDDDDNEDAEGGDCKGTDDDTGRDP